MTGKLRAVCRGGRGGECLNCERRKLLLVATGCPVTMLTKGGVVSIVPTLCVGPLLRCVP